MAWLTGALQAVGSSGVASGGKGLMGGGMGGGGGSSAQALAPMSIGMSAGPGSLPTPQAQPPSKGQSLDQYLINQAIMDRYYQGKRYGQ
jgi:hypothetical protein